MSLNDAGSYPLSFSVDFHPESATLEKEFLRITVYFSFKTSGKDLTEFASVDCIIGSDHSVRQGFQPSPEQIDSFKEAAAIYHCWPFFREYIHNVVTRMNYLPPAIPFLWITSKTARPTSTQPEVDVKKKVVKRRRHHRRRAAEISTSE